ncbi:leucine-rich repeat domain-containing protein [Xanthocytophaga flava]|uniref:leucine-rich repeat domain-containing protein n=1 Tax=Xanthocytophaga flava TaxID=3048013 RepID=UPI0028D28DE0|nr:leucine-rich repeat domain-containing protein [Xanthocytophaga flavus]MDJ1473763.1 leucine-rich repeat domain-containing protein [Xanthocytophaga flavus]
MDITLEKENCMRLLQSGQLESIQVGLETAQSLSIDISEFLADMEILYHWMTTGQERKESTLAEKILRIYSGWEHVHSREVLDMTHTSPYEIDTVPGQIRYLTHLREFIIVGQPITDLPDELAQLTGLQKVDLYNNSLGHVPKVLGSLTQLKELKLGSNALKELPDEIWNLTQLEILNLYLNQLTEVSPQIARLVHLKKLDLTGNPMSAQMVAQIREWLPGCKVRF